ncbi:hypothetical protein D2N39_11520 [Gemmobacter lutimaris]|uniref:Uncharacterized protein n=1 Tax=Gemmobacter lutimaris TaxID=2306023 RepID=A0A398BMC3_9RHOB|nr:hypothetical protein [Gemmobacter lutimaris]RID91859.1 hypothetical protein D2N39_11520 [Gemmobacter lutimaris]
MTDRNWREAKLPTWVKDSIISELNAVAIRAALSWPNEGRPVPVPFRWGDYDNLVGTPEEGVFWTTEFNAVGSVRVARNDGIAAPVHKTWRFSCDGGNWSTTVVRGPLFRTEREARLALLWQHCDRFAVELAALRKPLCM